MNCPRCGDYMGWQADLHDEACDRRVAVERALDSLLDALLHADDWETDAAFWLAQIERLELQS